VVEDRFYPQNRFTAANATTIGPGLEIVLQVSQ